MDRFIDKDCWLLKEDETNLKSSMDRFIADTRQVTKTM